MKILQQFLILDFSCEEFYEETTEEKKIMCIYEHVDKYIAYNVFKEDNFFSSLSFVFMTFRLFI